jgi:hypothetical protein
MTRSDLVEALAGRFAQLGKGNQKIQVTAGGVLGVN